MITYLDSVLDPAELSEMTDQGYVQVRFHPDFPYAIYCYTKKAMFDRKWNNTTRVCRGLIANEETGEVLARPFKKFFNYGEPNAVHFDPDDWVTVYDKLDGSLGIAYETPEGPAIATKGSFTSEQAKRATELLRNKYPRYFTDDVNTDLFEIILPENRIVLNYGDEESLRYLGSVDIADGSDYWNGILMRHWDIPCNHFVVSGEWRDVLPSLDMNRPNAEGYVIHSEEKNARLKMKQEDYIELHRVMTGLNERQIWEWFRDKELVDVLIDLPEELHEWVTQTWNTIDENFRELSLQMIQAYHESKHYDRKEFALFNKGKPQWMQGALFARYDNNIERAAEIIWKQVKP